MVHSGYIIYSDFDEGKPFLTFTIHWFFQCLDRAPMDIHEDSSIHISSCELVTKQHEINVIVFRKMIQVGG